MEQIPTEVMEKINRAKQNKAANCDPRVSQLIRDTFESGAEFGYRLLCEGKEKEIAELKEGANKDSDSLAAIAIEYNKRLSEIASLEAENERLEEIIQLGEITNSDLIEKIITKDKENERLRLIIDTLWWATDNPFDKVAIAKFEKFKTENNL